MRSRPAGEAVLGGHPNRSGRPGTGRDARVNIAACGQNWKRIPSCTVNGGTVPLPFGKVFLSKQLGLPEVGLTDKQAAGSWRRRNVAFAGMTAPVVLTVPFGPAGGPGHWLH